MRVHCDKMTFSGVNTWPVLCFGYGSFQGKRVKKIIGGRVISEMKYKIAQYVGYKGFNANPIISLHQLLKI